MKKRLMMVLTGLMVLSLSLASCGGPENQNTSENAPESQKQVQEEKVYGLGETWTVDGQWNFTINAVSATDERNQFSDQNPAQVVVITYSYDNIGYQGEIQDLFFSGFQVLDGSNQIAQSYPVNITTYPQPVPVGASCVNAEDAYGLNTASTEITVKVEKYDNKGNEQSATFKVPVQ